QGLEERAHPALEGEDEDRRDRHQDQRQEGGDEQPYRPLAHGPLRARPPHFPSSGRTRSFHTASTMSRLARVQPPKSSTVNGSRIVPKAGFSPFSASSG